MQDFRHPQLIISYILVILFCCAAASPEQSQKNTTLQNSTPVENNDPNTIISPDKYLHTIEGCPENSYCNDKLAKPYQQWTKFLKKLKGIPNVLSKKIEAHRKKYGIPIKIWITDETKRNDFIHWNSTCERHNKEDSKIFEGIIFAKNLQNIESKFIHLEQAIWFDKNQNSIFKIPRQSRPAYLENDQLVFIMDEDDLFFGLKISKKGNLSITPLRLPVPLPAPVACPKTLDASFALSEDEASIFLETYCVEIYNRTSKKQETLMFMRACR